MPEFDLDTALAAPADPSPEERMAEMLTELRKSQGVLFGPKNFPDPWTLVDFWNCSDFFIYCAPEDHLEEFQTVVDGIRDTLLGERLRSVEPHDVELSASGKSLRGKLALVTCSLHRPERLLKIILLQGDPADAYSAIFGASGAAPRVIEVFGTCYDTKGFDDTPLGRVVNDAEAKPETVLQGAGTEAAISRLWPHRCPRLCGRPRVYTAFGRGDEGPPLQPLYDHRSPNCS